MSVPEDDKTERTYLEIVLEETGLWGATKNRKSLFGLEGLVGRDWEVRASYIFLQIIHWT